MKPEMSYQKLLALGDFPICCKRTDIDVKYPIIYSLKRLYFCLVKDLTTMDEQILNKLPRAKAHGILSTRLDSCFIHGLKSVDFTDEFNKYTNNNLFDKIYGFAKRLQNWFGIPKNTPDTTFSEANRTGTSFFRNGIEYQAYSNLDKKFSAFDTLTTSQKLFIFPLTFLLLASLIFFPVPTLSFVVGVLTLIYFLDFLFSLLIICHSFDSKSELRIASSEIADIKDLDLPRYTILCPLYRESEVIEQFALAIANIDWPKDKLEVILLLEEDDPQTINKAYGLKLPDYFRIEIVPNSLPKTKPKACNWGLQIASGEYVVVYDAEDKPDPLQLKKAYLAFKRSDKRVICLQSKLNYYNQNQNLLTRIFTAEYSYWFDIALPGLQTLNTIIPLGGTSNHFVTDILKKLGGWDPFNVTEDCDLGTRLFKQGYRTSIIDSETLEEANSNLKSWIRQRSRWIKGYMQTYLVHMRNPWEFFKKHKVHALLFQLIIGMRMVFMIINPILWLTTILYFTAYPIFGPFIESLYPWYVFYPAVFCLIFANFTYFYSYMIASAKKGKWELIGYIFAIPFYWVLTSVSAVIALYQLITKPYYWEKTKHGLHLETQTRKSKWLVFPKISIEPVFEWPKFNLFSKYFGRFVGGVANLMRNLLKDRSVMEIFANASENLNIRKTSSQYGLLGSVGKFLKSNLQRVVIGGGLLVSANIFANFTNYLYNAVLGRSLSYEDFGWTSLISNLNLFLGVVTASLGLTVTYKSAILLGRRGGIKKDFWRVTRKNIFNIFFPIGIAVLLLSHYFTGGTSEANEVSAVLVAVVLMLPVSAVASVDGGFLSGNLKFAPLAFLVVLLPVVKFLSGYIGIVIGNINIIFFSQAIATVITFFVGWVIIVKLPKQKTTRGVKESIKFPKKFYLTSVMNRFSLAFFLSADVILAKFFLSAGDAGKYAILSLIGKSIFFFGSLVTQFITPVVSKEIGEGKEGLRSFYKLFFLTLLATSFAFVVLGVFPQKFAVLMFGNKVYEISSFVFKYALAISAFTIAYTISLFHQTKKQYLFSYLGFLLSAFEVLYILLYHGNIHEIVESIYQVSISYLLASSVLHIVTVKNTALKVNLLSLAKLFLKTKISKPVKGKANILIYNWRDTKHKWQGGAEVYVQEIAQRFVKKGYGVTVFCGNDGALKYDETVGGVKIVRRGGFFTLYFWAAVYYLLKFRSNFDFIIDCENGIPFYTPLYSTLPKILLIHHVHQQVFRENLPFPLKNIAVFLESDVMKSVYRDVKIVTVSQSSRNDILELGLNTNGEIDIISPGVNMRSYSRLKKFDYPTFCYLGRLMPYKNVDVLIRSFKNVVSEINNAKLIIAGKGQSEESLKILSEKLGLSKNVEFRGYVTDLEKKEILSRSWVMVQPSSFEGWGITVIEANASHTPVIASNTAGLRDSVVDGQTGILVKTGSVKELTRVMIALSEMNGYRKRLSENAYAWSRNFSWNSAVYRFINIIDNEIEDQQKSAVPAYSYSET